MPLLVLAVAIILFSATLLTMALLMSREVRLLIQRRVALVGKVYRPLRRVRAIQTTKTPTIQLTDTLRRFFTFGLASGWGMRTTGPMLLLLGGGSGAIVWLVTAFALHVSNWIALVAAAAAFILVPRFILLRQKSRSEGQFVSLFPDAIDMGVRMLRAGLPITAAIQAIGNEAPAPVNATFKTLADQVTIGIPFDEALAVTGERIGIADFRFFATAVALQRSTGGNLAATLEILGDIIRKRRAVRLKAQATTAEVRVSAYILGAMPFLVIGALMLLQPRYLYPLVSDPRGKIIMGIAAGLLTLGFYTMRRMMKSATQV